MAAELDGGKGVWEDVGGEEVGGGERLGHWTAEMGMDRALGGAAQNKSAGPEKNDEISEYKCLGRNIQTKRKDALDVDWVI